MVTAVKKSLAKQKVSECHQQPGGLEGKNQAFKVLEF